MARQYVTIAILFVVLTLLQVMIFNNLLLFGVAAPIVFIYTILRLPVSMNRNAALTVAFLAGFCVDVFADTPGVNALACTLLVAVRHPVFRAYTSKEIETEGLIPSVYTLGWGVYMKYLFTLVLIYCVLVFCIEYFSFFDIEELLLSIGASTLLSFVLLLSIDSIMMPKSEKRL